jgi:hypothetical protein
MHLFNATAGAVVRPRVVRDHASAGHFSRQYVAVEGVDISALTDSRGNYSLSLPPGRYQFARLKSVI